MPKSNTPPEWSCNREDDHESHTHFAKRDPSRDAFEEPCLCPGQPFECERCGVQLHSAGVVGWYKHIDEESASWLCNHEDPSFHLSLRHRPARPVRQQDIDAAIHSILRTKESL